jgi:futalosine hydrolase
MPIQVYGKLEKRIFNSAALPAGGLFRTGGWPHFMNSIRRAALSTMFLAVAATEIEISPLLRLLNRDDVPCLTLVSGVGPIETAIRLTAYLANRPAITGVVNLGVAGGYVFPPGSEGPALLDLYLAETEVFGDLGICFPDRIDPLPEDLAGATSFRLDRQLLAGALKTSEDYGLGMKTGNFVTVAAVSATRTRGEMLRERFEGHCENMEGAAICRVCAGFSLPVLEIRSISNLVEDRDTERWRMREACEKSAQAAAIIIKTLTERS